MLKQNCASRTISLNRARNIAVSETVAVSELTVYSAASAMTSNAATRARLRILQEMEREKLTQTDVATFTGWSQSKVSKALHGRLDLSLDDVDVLANAVGLPLTEVVRDHGVEFCAEMTSTEMRLLEQLRQAGQDDRDAVLTLLRNKAKGRTEERRAMPRQKRKIVGG